MMALLFTVLGVLAIGWFLAYHRLPALVWLAPFAIFATV